MCNGWPASIKNPEKLMMWPPAGFDGPMEWAFLKGAWGIGSNISPMDIDGVVERYCHFLMFETKDVGVPIQDGQRWTIENLIKVGAGRITFLMLRGKTQFEIEGMEEWFWSAEKQAVAKVDHGSCDHIQVYNLVDAWWKKINSGGY